MTRPAEEVAAVAVALDGIKEALVVRPGDTLILRLRADASPDEFERFRERASTALKERMPDVDVLVIGNVEQMAVYRPGSAS